MLVVKKLPANVRDTRSTGLIPGLGRSPGVGNGNPLQYSCLENSMDRGAWQVTVHGVTESDMTERTHTHTHTHTHTRVNILGMVAIQILSQLLSFAMVAQKQPQAIR